MTRRDRILLVVALGVLWLSTLVIAWTNERSIDRVDETSCAVAELVALDTLLVYAAGEPDAELFEAISGAVDAVIERCGSTFLDE